MKPASGIPYWPSRDPIGERGGMNLYGFVGNDGVAKLDVLGETTCEKSNIGKRLNVKILATTIRSEDSEKYWRFSEKIRAIYDSGSEEKEILGVFDSYSAEILKNGIVDGVKDSLQGIVGEIYDSATEEAGKELTKMADGLMKKTNSVMDEFSHRKVYVYFMMSYDICCCNSWWFGPSLKKRSTVMKQGRPRTGLPWQGTNDPNILREILGAADEAIKFIKSGLALQDAAGHIIHDECSEP